MRGIIVLLVGFVLASCGPGDRAVAPQVALSSQGTAAPSAFDAAFANTRAAAGLARATEDRRLAIAAAEHAEDMAARGYFAHTSPEGGTFVQRAAAVGVGGCWMAENIAMGQRDEAGVLAAWMASPPHRRNMLNRRVATYGIGRSGTYWVLMLSGC